MMKRVGIFIDVQNIQEVFERQGAEVRYDRIKSYLTNRYKIINSEIVKFVAFIPYRNEDDRRMKLIDAISLMGYRVISKVAKDRPDGTVKANMDLEMALEILSMSDSLDEIVIVTGDSDFFPLINVLSRKGKTLKFEYGFYLSRNALPQARDVFIEWYKDMAYEKISFNPDCFNGSCHTESPSTNPRA